MNSDHPSAASESRSGKPGTPAVCLDESHAQRIAGLEQFAQHIHQLRIFLEAFGQDFLADFHDFTIRHRDDGGAALFSREQGHFAKTIARGQ